MYMYMDICILYYIYMYNMYYIYIYMYSIHICLCVSVLCVCDSVILYDRIVVSLASMAVPRLSQSHGNRPVQGSFEEIKRGT